MAADGGLLLISLFSLFCVGRTKTMDIRNNDMITYFANHITYLTFGPQENGTCYFRNNDMIIYFVNHITYLTFGPQENRNRS